MADHSDIVRRLFQDVARTKTGRHVTKQETVDFSVLSRSKRRRVTGHIMTCTKSRETFRKLQRICQEARLGWEGPEGERRLEAFRKRVLSSIRFWLLSRRASVKQRKGFRVVIPITRGRQ